MTNQQPSSSEKDESHKMYKHPIEKIKKHWMQMDKLSQSSTTQSSALSSNSSTKGSSASLQIHEGEGSTPISNKIASNSLRTSSNASTPTDDMDQLLARKEQLHVPLSSSVNAPQSSTHISSSTANTFDPLLRSTVSNSTYDPLLKIEKKALNQEYNVQNNLQKSNISDSITGNQNLIPNENDSFNSSLAHASITTQHVSTSIQPSKSNSTVQSSINQHSTTYSHPTQHIQHSNFSQPYSQGIRHVPTSHSYPPGYNPEPEYDAPINFSELKFTRKYNSANPISNDNSQSDYGVPYPSPVHDYPSHVIQSDSLRKYPEVTPQYNQSSISSHVGGSYIGNTNVSSHVTTNHINSHISTPMSHVTEMIPDSLTQLLQPEKSIKNTFETDDGQKITVVNVKRNHYATLTPEQRALLLAQSSKKRKIQNPTPKKGKKNKKDQIYTMNQGSIGIPMQPIIQGVNLPYFYPTQVPPAYPYPKIPTPIQSIALQKTPITPEIPVNTQPIIFPTYGTPTFGTPTSIGIPTFGTSGYLNSATPKSPHGTQEIPYISNSLIDESLHCEVKISNLTEEACKEQYLMKIFSECGKIFKIRIPTLSLPFYFEKPKYKGIAYITFTTLVGADKAILKFNNDFLAGSRICVELFKLPKITTGLPSLTDPTPEIPSPVECSELYIVNLPLEHLRDESTVQTMWETFGPVISCAIPKGSNGQPIGYIFVKYKFAKDAANALAMNNTFHHGRKIQVRYADKKHQNRNYYTGFTTWIFVGGLPPTTTTFEIKSKFSIFGQIEEIEDSQVESKSYAFIRFKSVESVREALKYKRDGIYVLERMNFPEEHGKDSILYSLQQKFDENEDLDEDLDDPNIPNYLQRELFGWKNGPPIVQMIPLQPQNPLIPLTTDAKGNSWE